MNISTQCTNRPKGIKTKNNGTYKAKNKPDTQTLP